MVKVISLSNEAYKRLKELKRDESFSEIVIELIEEKRNKKKNIMEFAGAFADNAEEWESIKKILEKDRKKAKLREVNFDVLS